MFFNELGDFVWILVRDQASGKLCEGFGRNYGLRAFALVAAPDAIEFQSWANPQPLHGRKSGFADVRRGADGLFEISFLPRQGVEGFAFGGRDLGDVIVKAGDHSLEILVVQFGEQLGQNRQRIGNRAAVHAGMQIARGPGQFDLVVVQATQAVGDGRERLWRAWRYRTPPAHRLLVFLCSFERDPTG